MCAINRISMLLRTAPTVVPTSVAQPISDTQPAASVSVISAFVERVIRGDPSGVTQVDGRPLWMERN
jgi:hypothetical protein